MNEMLKYQNFDKLSLSSTQRLLSGDYSPSTVDQIQRETNAYFLLKPEEFGGVLFHPDGKGPEKPNFKPEEADLAPEIQAISRIGVQYYYWDMLYKAVMKRRIDYKDMMSMNILPLYPTPDGGSLVKTGSYPPFLKNVVERAGDKTSRFPKYIKQVNYDGDADFYGPWENQIFPMDVKTVDDSRVYVDKSQLGLTDEKIDASWLSWKKIHTIESRFYHAATVGTIKYFPPQIMTTIKNRLEKGEIFGGGYAIVSACMKDGIFNYEDQDLVISLVNQRVRELHNQDNDQTLLSALQSHSQNLEDLYTTARGSRSDIYDY